MISMHFNTFHAAGPESWTAVDRRWTAPRGHAVHGFRPLSWSNVYGGPDGPLLERKDPYRALLEERQIVEVATEIA